MFLTEQQVLDLDPWQMPLEQIDVSEPNLYKTDTHWEFFKRLRQEDPVHYCENSFFGPYWSITKFDDIMNVDKNHKDFSSVGGVTIGDRPSDFETPNFISLDPPEHGSQRKAVTGVVAPPNLAKLEPIIRERAAAILDDLPVGEEFNWVDKVSIELTTQMLATIFDFPFEERQLLTYWSDLATSTTATGGNMPESTRREGLMECLRVFTELRNERVNRDPNEHCDLLTMMAHSPTMNSMDSMEFLGNLILLIVGGNDTTRNSMSGGTYALNLFPEEYEKLRRNPLLINSMVPEIVRWQTPLAHMRRRCINDTEIGGKKIKAGEKVLLWYVSGNRDSEALSEPDKFIIDRKQPRHHLSFGFGIHRCMGNRLAEMQLRTVWEEILKRFKHVEVVGEPVRTSSNFVRGYEELPVVLHV